MYGLHSHVNCWDLVWSLVKVVGSFPTSFAPWSRRGFPAGFPPSSGLPLPGFPPPLVPPPPGGLLPRGLPWPPPKPPGGSEGSLKGRLDQLILPNSTIGCVWVTVAVCDITVDNKGKKVWELSGMSAPKEGICSATDWSWSSCSWAWSV